MRFLPMLLMLAGSAGAQILKLEILRTVDGKTFTDVNVTAKRPDGISITHSVGTARVKLEHIPPKVQAMLGGFDRDAAREARAKDESALAAAEAAITRQLAAMKEGEATTGAARKTQPRFVKNSDKLTVKPVIYGGVRCLQITVQAGANPLSVRFGGSRSYQPWETDVFYTRCGSEYRVTAWEGGTMVDQETSRAKTGLGSDYKLR
jgi:hypothetical protein